MRKRQAALLVAALVTSTPGLARGKGLPLTRVQLLKPTRFGDLTIRAGQIGFHRSGELAFGPIAEPFFPTPAAPIPKGALITFWQRPQLNALPPSDSNPYSEPHQTAFEASIRQVIVQSPFWWCGVGFAGTPEELQERQIAPMFVVKPKGHIVLSGWQSGLEGTLGQAIEHDGITMPVGSRLAVQCLDGRPVPRSWSGTLKQDTPIGAITLAGGTEAHVEFTPRGPSIVFGQPREAFVLESRCFPPASVIDRPAFDSPAVFVVCGQRSSMFVDGRWVHDDCSVSAVEHCGVAEKPPRFSRTSGIPAPTAPVASAPATQSPVTDTNWRHGMLLISAVALSGLLWLRRSNGF